MAESQQFELVTLAERPDLRPAVEGLQQTAWPTFMLHDDVAYRYWPQLLSQLPSYQYMLLAADGTLAAIGHCIPNRWDGAAGALPDRGWDWAVESGMVAFEQGVTPNVMCGLSISILPSFRGQGLGAKMVEAMRTIGQRQGFSQMFLPVRPNLKHAYPLTSMGQYMRWLHRDKDGKQLPEPFDPWLRIHLRLGGRFAKLCMQSMTVTGSVAEWESWTGLRFPDSGQYIIPSGMVPMTIDSGADLGTYVEPNIWIVHSI